jgi:hypothetical protein
MITAIAGVHHDWMTTVRAGFFSTGWSVINLLLLEMWHNFITSTLPIKKTPAKHLTNHLPINSIVPTTAPVNAGIRAINVALQQPHDVSVCLRHVRYFNGVLTPMIRPKDMDIVIFRENPDDQFLKSKPETACL